ncbi:hypothetical protein PMAYCL1PPCAC_00939 [Pristionchus mayeri]|uniref:protein-tyrosine-phosphatase n=1 Tax=Pristionchus mayeri TaxID=1317129 RepID=A0AAN4YZU7_9BILA|nr:hypothetical protein PMAYCL1PPCAC_00939 [Pristionchus mayeri]
MQSATASAATKWADWVLQSDRRASAIQYNEHINSYTVPNKLHGFEKMEAKYRYFNDGCFEWNRVVLKGRLPRYDFYHANSVHLEGDGQFHVIASQGPLYNTTDDFWEMVYQQKVAVIVQLCNYTEDYWPKKNQKTFGDCTVSLEAEGLIDANEPDVKLRTFSVRWNAESGVHTVRHIFYSKWPDFGVPATVTSVISIIRWIESNGGMTRNSPVLVHCLAGVGRTGSFILTMMALRRLRQLQSSEDYGAVMIDLAKELRRQRSGAIQTPQQYVFAHAAVLKMLAMVRYSKLVFLVQVFSVQLQHNFTRFVEM